MSLNNGTGIQYPEIELGGKRYTVKFTRGMLYRMGKLGVKFQPELVGGEQKQIRMDFTNLVDVLHVAIEFPGTHEELAELLYDKRNDAVTALVEAWAKMLPPATPATPAADVQPGAPPN